MIEFEVYMQGAVGRVPAVTYWILGLLLLIGVGVIYLYVNQNRCNHNDNNNVNQKHNWEQSVARLMLAEWIMLVFCSTVVFRSTMAESAISLVPLSSYFYIAENSYLLEVTVINMLNILMFVPIGILSGCSFKELSWKIVIKIGIGLSVTIELFQFLFRRGLCEIDDVIHNVIGCMIGYAISLLLFKIFKYL